MKIGRNDPCPCGSGKKYKNCCLGKEQEKSIYKEKLNKLYGQFYHINNEILNKSNKTNYSDANFNDAMVFTITSNVLSIIKAMINRNYSSATTALNIRNFFEAFILLTMSNDITDEQYKLFLEQYKIIEYNLYLVKCDTDPTLINDEVLINDYNHAKQVFMDTGMSETKFKRIFNTRVPFLCGQLPIT